MEVISKKKTKSPIGIKWWVILTCEAKGKNSPEKGESDKQEPGKKKAESDLQGLGWDRLGLEHVQEQGINLRNCAEKLGMRLKQSVISAQHSEA